MKGIVKGISHCGIRVAVLTDYGYTVFDIYSGETSIGDVLIGSLDEHGEVELKNLNTGDSLDVFIEAIHATRDTAIQLLQSI